MMPGGRGWGYEAYLTEKESSVLLNRFGPNTLNDVQNYLGNGNMNVDANATATLVPRFGSHTSQDATTLPTFPQSSRNNFNSDVDEVADLRKSSTEAQGKKKQPTGGQARKTKEKKRKRDCK